MTLTQLRYLVAIADANLNITAAALCVNATQPGVSKQIKLLEAELGFLIFERRGKSLERATQLGSRVIAHARDTLKEAERIQALSDDHRRNGNGELRIVSTQTQAQYVLPPVLKAFQNRYAGISIRQSLSNEPQWSAGADRVQDDIGIISGTGSPPAEGFAVPLFRWKRIALAPAYHPLALQSDRVELADLAAHPLIAYNSLAKSASSVSRTFASQGLTPQFAYTVQDSELIKHYVREEMGIGLLAEMAVTDTGYNGLVSIDVSHLFPQCTTWAILRRDVIIRRHMVEFIAMLAPRFSTQEITAFLKEIAPLPDRPAPDWQEAVTSFPSGRTHTTEIQPRMDRVIPMQSWRQEKLGSGAP